MTTHSETAAGLVSSRTVDEKKIGTANETYLVSNVDDGYTHGFSGTYGAKYADVMSEDDAFTMAVLFNGFHNLLLAPIFRLSGPGPQLSDSKHTCQCQQRHVTDRSQRLDGQSGYATASFSDTCHLRVAVPELSTAIRR